MTKIPGELEPPKPITKAEREARKAFRQLDAEKAMTEHEIAQKAFSANRERLKAKVGGQTDQGDVAWSVIGGAYSYLLLQDVIAISGDAWPDDIRLSDIEPRFTCQACGKRGADVRPKFPSAKMGT